MTLSARWTRWPIGFLIVLNLAGCDLVLRLTEDLELTAAKTSLGVGESVQVTVRKKWSWFRVAEPIDPSRTVYWTTSESALVVEPDGRVTCVGTFGQLRESAWISANNGRSVGHLSFDLGPDGPGAALEFVPLSTDLPPLPDDAQSPFVPCCAPPLALKEGQQMRFRIRARASGLDLTSSAGGTRYTLFFGSGVPNDTDPARVTGGPNAVSARTFLLNDGEGIITAPPSIARLNRARVIVFFRHRDLVGWREIVVIHK